MTLRSKTCKSTAVWIVDIVYSEPVIFMDMEYSKVIVYRRLCWRSVSAEWISSEPFRFYLYLLSFLICRPDARQVFHVESYQRVQVCWCIWNSEMFAFFLQWFHFQLLQYNHLIVLYLLEQNFCHDGNIDSHPEHIQFTLDTAFRISAPTWHSDTAFREPWAI